jgi:hypothetical protein
MRIISFLVCCLLFFTGCSKDESLPIERDKLIKVLLDVHIAEAAMVHLSTLNKDSVAGEYYRQVFQRHNLDQATFDSCIHILKRNPAMTDEIYERIAEEYDKLKLEISKQQ